MLPINRGQVARSHELIQLPTHSSVFLHLLRERLVRRYHGDGVECPAEVMLPVTRDLELIKYSSVSNARCDDLVEVALVMPRVRTWPECVRRALSNASG
jgi:hypothetical protein